MLSRKLAALSLHSKKLNGFRVISLKFGGKSRTSIFRKYDLDLIRPDMHLKQDADKGC